MAKKIKYLLIREVKHLNTENYETLIKLKMIQRNGKISHALELKELICLSGHTTQRDL